ncbi:MAG: hypothetical protein ACR2OA_13920 [Rubripirellula sp.]
MRHKFVWSLFGPAHNPTTGTVRGQAIGNYFLRSGVADIDEIRHRDHHVRRFVYLNPGYTEGDELCCLAPLSVENFTPAARRVIAAKHL